MAPRLLRMSIFPHDNNMAGEFNSGSGINHSGIEGENTVSSMFYCILGRARLESACSLKNLIAQ